jgi:hypothetical protein
MRQSRSSPIFEEIPAEANEQEIASRCIKPCSTISAFFDRNKRR